MTDHALILSQRWTDILPPPVPAAINSVWLLASIALLLIAILVVALLWQRRPRQSARRVLRQCRQATQRHDADTRLIAYRTYRAIHDGLRLVAMRQDLVAVDREAWNGFYRRLQSGVFAAKPPDRKEVQILIRDGFYWLKHYVPR